MCYEYGSWFRKARAQPAQKANETRDEAKRASAPVPQPDKRATTPREREKTPA